MLQNEQLKELARKKRQKREKEAKSAAAAAPEEGSESDKKPLGRPPGRKDAAKRGLGNFSLDDPGMLPVLAGWCLTLFVVAAAIGAYVFVAHVAQRDIRTVSYTHLTLPTKA